MPSMAAARGWQRAGQIPMAMKGRMVMDFILERLLCKSGAWTAGLTGNVLLRRTFDRRLQEDSALRKARILMLVERFRECEPKARLYSDAGLSRLEGLHKCHRCHSGVFFLIKASSPASPRGVEFEG